MQYTGKKTRPGYYKGFAAHRNKKAFCFCNFRDKKAPSIDCFCRKRVVFEAPTIGVFSKRSTTPNRFLFSNKKVLIKIFPQKFESFKLRDTSPITGPIKNKNF